MFIDCRLIRLSLKAFALPVLQTVYETRKNMSAPATSKQTNITMSESDRDPSFALYSGGLVAQSRVQQWAGYNSLLFTEFIQHKVHELMLEY